MLVATTALTATPLLIAPSAYAQMITQGGWQWGIGRRCVGQTAPPGGKGDLAGGGGGAGGFDNGGQAAQTLNGAPLNGSGTGGGANGLDITGGGGGGGMSSARGGNGGLGMFDGVAVVEIAQLGHANGTGRESFCVRMISVKAPAADGRTS